ncbi:MAG: HutD family protein [Bacteroidales bacterium]|nr:HutD family protein [Bacteroidales bacterium]MBN2756673.1 HutD family protein [Bacteroidales bacterium]
MEFTIIKSQNLKTNNWLGGTTTQLFIFPQNSDYQKRNFIFRLSTATVEIEKSDFTSLPEISRKLMILDGKIIIKHENQYTKQLNKFDIDEFEGDWKTSSTGMCTDFNLMTFGNIKSKLNSKIIEKDQSFNYQTEKKWNWLFIYVYKGKISIEINNKTNILNNADFIAIKEPISANIKIKAIEKSELVFTEIENLLYEK